MFKYQMLIAAFLFTVMSWAQDKTIHDYKFVIVPEIYDFQNSKNEYRLNEMTKFYLEQQGFYVYYQEDFPKDSNCEGLYADVIKKNTLFGTRLQLVLNDCKKNTVFSSREGSSKFKELHKAHQDALRSAMQTLPKVNMKGVELATKKGISKKTTLSKSEKQNAETNHYIREGRVYVLQELDSGFSLYLKSDSEDLMLTGKIIRFGDTYTFLDETGKTGSVIFDTEETFVVEFAEEKQHYKLLD